MGAPKLRAAADISRARLNPTSFYVFGVFATSHVIANSGFGNAALLRIPAQRGQGPVLPNHGQPRLKGCGKGLCVDQIAIGLTLL